MEPKDQDPNKQSSQRIPFTHLEQVGTDFIVALAMQEEERNYTMLETIESDSDENENDDQDNSDEGMEYSETRELLEGEDSTYNEEDEEMDTEDDDFLDELDELTYEELIALGDFIGEEKRGLSVNEIASCLLKSTCRLQVDDQKNVQSNGIDRCVICQVEYEGGEELVALPCEHPYHSDCIVKWLQIKKICPICCTEVSSK